MQKRVYTRGINIGWLNHGSGSDQGVAVHNKKAVKKQTGIANSEKTSINNRKTEDALNAELNESINSSSSMNGMKVMDAAKKGNQNLKSIAPKNLTLKGNVLNKVLANSPNVISKPIIKAAAKHIAKSNKTADVPVGLLYVLCFFIPWLAVGLVTDWDLTPVISNLLWTLLCGIPGIIHAIVVVSRES